MQQLRTTLAVNNAAEHLDQSSLCTFTNHFFIRSNNKYFIVDRKLSK